MPRFLMSGAVISSRHGATHRWQDNRVPQLSARCGELRFGTASIYVAKLRSSTQQYKFQNSDYVATFWTAFYSYRASFQRVHGIGSKWGKRPGG